MFAAGAELRRSIRFGFAAATGAGDGVDATGAAAVVGEVGAPTKSANSSSKPAKSGQLLLRYNTTVGVYSLSTGAGATGAAGVGSALLVFTAAAGSSSSNPSRSTTFAGASGCFDAAFAVGCVFERAGARVEDEEPLALMEFERRGAS